MSTGFSMTAYASSFRLAAWTTPTSKKPTTVPHRLYMAPQKMITSASNLAALPPALPHRVRPLALDPTSAALHPAGAAGTARSRRHRVGFLRLPRAGMMHPETARRGQLLYLALGF